MNDDEPVSELLWTVHEFSSWIVHERSRTVCKVMVHEFINFIMIQNWPFSVHAHSWMVHEPFDELSGLVHEQGSWIVQEQFMPVH